MARDLSPLVSAQRAAVAWSQAELADLDRHLAALEVFLATGDPDPNICFEKGGESEDQLRVRAGLPRADPAADHHLVLGPTGVRGTGQAATRAILRPCTRGVCCAIYTVITRRWISTSVSTAQVVVAQQAHALALGLYWRSLPGSSAARCGPRRSA